LGLWGFDFTFLGLLAGIVGLEVVRFLSCLASMFSMQK